MLKEGIITLVKYSEWAAPVVPILKLVGTVRLCGDYKLTVNTVSSLEQYPIPRVDDLFAALAEGEQFSKLDMSHAYQQILMDNDSKKIPDVEHTSRTVHIQTTLQTAVWSGFCTRHIPKDHGGSVERNSTNSRVPG